MNKDNVSPEAKLLREANERLNQSLERLKAAIAERGSFKDATAEANDLSEELLQRCEKLESENKALRKALEKSDDGRRAIEKKNNAALGRLDNVVGQLRNVLSEQ